MFEAFNLTNVEEKQLWTDFISTYRQYSLALCPKGLIYK